MASVSLSSADYEYGGRCYVTVSGLSAAWNTSNYSSAGITTTPFTNGQASQPSGTVSSTSAPSSGSSTSFGWTATGLGYGSKTYYCWVKGAGSGGLYWSVGSASITIPSPPVIPGYPTGISHSVNGQNCTITFTKGTNADYTGLYYYYYNNPEGGTYITTTGTSFSLTGLGNNNTYRYQLISYTYAGQSSGYTSEYTFTTGVGRPSNFYFTTSFVSGGDAEIDSNDWYYFKNKINEFRQYKGLSNYSFSYNPSVGASLSAVDFNQVRNALYDLRTYMTGSYANGTLLPSTKNTGDDVYAAFFTNMQNSLNSIS